MWAMAGYRYGAGEGSRDLAVDYPRDRPVDENRAFDGDWYWAVHYERNRPVDWDQALLHHNDRLSLSVGGRLSELFDPFLDVVEDAQEP